MIRKVIRCFVLEIANRFEYIIYTDDIKSIDSILSFWNMLKNIEVLEEYKISVVKQNSHVLVFFLN